MIKLNLTKEKADILIQLLDIALKSGGLQVAKAVLVLTDDITNAVKQAEDGPEGADGSNV